MPAPRPSATNWFSRTRMTLLLAGAGSLLLLVSALAVVVAEGGASGTRANLFATVLVPIGIVALVSAAARLQERNDVRHGRPGLRDGTGRE